MIYPEFNPDEHVIPKSGGKTLACIAKVKPGMTVCCPTEIAAARMRQLLDDAGKKDVEVIVLPYLEEGILP